MDTIIGKTLGRYHVLEQLGEGGMAIVYKAFDTRLETNVALKVIRTERLALEVANQTLKRFEREAKALARLNHPNIIKVIDYGEHEGRPYLVMPFLTGGTLKQVLGRPIPWQQAAALLLPVGQALEYAHAHDLIHRDVKPANILMTDTGQPLLSDFGVARLLDPEQTTDITSTGTAIGTPEYMAPEYGLGLPVGRQVDIYSLGIIFYEMVTGRKPYVADTPLAVLYKHASDPLPRPTQFVQDLPEAVEQVLLKALAKKPENRYQEMGEFIRALAALAGGQKIAPGWQNAAPPPPRAAPARASATGRRRWLPFVIGVGIFALVGLALLAGGLLMANLGGGAARPAATSRPTQRPTATASSARHTVYVSASEGWQPTNIRVSQGDWLTISVAGGSWTYFLGTADFNTGEGWGYICAEAMPASECTEPLPTFPSGALIGSIDGEAFGVGSGMTLTAQRSGVLSFRINDTDTGLLDNDGTLIVSVTIR